MRSRQAELGPYDGHPSVLGALRRHVNSARLKLWTASWTLIFIHFAVEVFEPRQGTMQSILFSIDWGSLQLSAMFFVASLTSFVEQKSKTWTLLGLTALPVLIYTVAASFDSHYRALYIGCLAVMFWGSMYPWPKPRRRGCGQTHPTY